MRVKPYVTTLYEEISVSKIVASLRNRILLRDISWSLFGNITSVASGIAVIKIIAKLVPVGEYGQAALVLGILALLNNFVAGPALVIHLRLYFDHLRRGTTQTYIGVARLVLFLLSIGVTGLYIVIALAYRSRGIGLYLHLLLPALIIILLQPHLSAMTNYLEAHRRYRGLAFANVLPKVLQIPLLFILLKVTSSGSKAIVLAQALAMLPGLLFLLHSFAPKHRVEGIILPRDPVRFQGSIFRFGGVIQAGYLAMWVLTTSDRYLVDHFLSVKLVGIYVMNYGLWSIPYLVLNGWLETLTRSRIYDRAARSDWVGVKRILLWRLGTGLAFACGGTLLIILVGQSLAIHLIGNYWGGRRLMALLAAGHVFFVVGYSIVPLFLAAKRARTILIATCVAAGVNLALNWALLPRLGVLGAGLNTLVGYVVWAGLLGIGAQVVWKSLLREEGGLRSEMLQAPAVL